MIFLISLVTLLSLFDLWATLQWIVVNPNLEANILMFKLWEINPQLFIWAKLFSIALFCVVAYFLRENKLMQKLIWLPFCAYVYVIILHLQII